MTNPHHAPAPGPQAAPVAAAYFDAAHLAFRAAERQRGAYQANFVIGGQSIRLCFAGRAWLPQFTAALAHRAAPGPRLAQPDLTICVWDDASTGAPMPPAPWPRAAYTPRGEIIEYSDARYRTAYELGPGLLSLLDVRQGLALLWTADVARLPRYELTFPARALLYWWAAGHGQQLAHGGAVGWAGAGALLVGKGGSGKSTTALACLEAGMDYAGDDYVLFDDQLVPRAHSVYCSGKLHADHIGRLPVYVPIIQNREQLGPEKALLYLNEHYAGQMAADVPLSAIVLPRFTGAAHPSYRPISTVQALAALSASTLRQLPGAGQADYDRMRRLARRLPAYALELGTDPSEIPPVMARLMAEAGR